MTLADGALLTFRVVGALWLLGGAFLIRTLMTFGKIERDLERVLPDAAHVADDRGRDRWMLAGGVFTALAGLCMLIGTRFAVVALAVLIIHQLAYFVRQRRRELAAVDMDDQAAARPANTTIRAFYFSLIMAVLGAWLLGQGALR